MIFGNDSRQIPPFYTQWLICCIKERSVNSVCGVSRSCGKHLSTHLWLGGWLVFWHFCESNDWSAFLTAKGWGILSLGNSCFSSLSQALRSKQNSYQGLFGLFLARSGQACPGDSLHLYGPVVHSCREDTWKSRQQPAQRLLLEAL